MSKIPYRNIIVSSKDPVINLPSLQNLARPVKCRIGWRKSVVLINKVIAVAYLDDSKQRWAAVTWMLITVTIVLIFHIKIIAKYILENNLVGVFKSDPKYGPPELEDRKKRRNFNELYHSRQCKHACLIIDGSYECNHLPLMFKDTDHLTSGLSSASRSSLTNIYDAGPSRKRASSIIDASILHMN